MATALVLVSLAAAAGLLASNMGFKLQYGLLSAPNKDSFDGTQSLGLPFFRKARIDDADSLINDIGSRQLQSVQRYLESTCEIETRTWGGAGPNFNLETAEGYFVKMFQDRSYVIVGSHDPSFAVDLDAASEPNSCDGTNFYAYPYHSTVRTCRELIDDIGSASVQNVQRYWRAVGTMQTCTSSAGTDFPLNPGEAYFIKMTRTTAYVPSHY